MLCMSDVILINLLTVLIFIYDFVKIIFIEQAGLPTFFPQGKKTNVDEDTLKGLLSRCSFCLKFCLTFYGDWHGIAGMADLASLILSLCFLHPLMLTLPLLKMLIYFYWGRETLFFPQVLLFILVSQKDGLAHCFFLTLPFSGSLFPSQQGWKTSEGPTQNYIYKQPIPTTINKYPGTEFRQLHLCHSQSEFPAP